MDFLSCHDMLCHNFLKKAIKTEQFHEIRTIPYILIPSWHLPEAKLPERQRWRQAPALNGILGFAWFDHQPTGVKMGNQMTLIGTQYQKRVQDDFTKRIRIKAKIRLFLRAHVFCALPSQVCANPLPEKLPACFCCLG